MGKMDPTFEDAIYEQVAGEIRRNELQPGLMAKAAAKAEGNADLARSLYLQFRAEQIRRELDDAARKQRAAAEESKQQAVLFAKAESQRKRAETQKQFMGRWRPRVGFAFGLVVVATVYWLGSGVSLGKNWPGLVNIRTSDLIVSFLWSAILPPFMAGIVWLPIWIWLKIRNKERKHSPFLFIIIVSLLFVILELTGTARILTAVGFGQDGMRDPIKWGPWDCLKTQAAKHE